VSIVRYAVVAGWDAFWPPVRCGQDAKSSEVVATPLEPSGARRRPSPRRASMAVVSGDPSKAAPFVVRLKMPAGYKINPLPSDGQNVTVISGTFAVAMGDTFAAAG
jgi:hypothetical protein